MKSTGDAILDDDLRAAERAYSIAARIAGTLAVIVGTVAVWFVLRWGAF